MSYCPHAERIRYQQSRLTRLLKHAQSHDYTKHRIPQIPIIEDQVLSVLDQVIPIDSSDHTKYVKRISECISVKKPNSKIVFSSGGTTGLPKAILLSFDEMLLNTVKHGMGYAAAGVGPHDIVLTYGQPGFFASEFTVYHGLAQTGCTTLPLGISEDPSLVESVIQQFRCTVLIVMPSNLIPLVQYLSTCGKELPHIRLILTGGEAMPESLKKKIQTLSGYKKGIQFRSTFQTADVGTIGFQCSYLDHHTYHIQESLQYVEIEENDQGVGELIITNLSRYEMPVVRIKTGDLASWSHHRCPCGRSDRVLRLLGRNSIYIKVGGEKFNTNCMISLAEFCDIPLEKIVMKIIKGPHNEDRLCFLTTAQLIKKITPDIIFKFITSANEKITHQIKRGLVSFDVDIISSEDVVYSVSGKRKYVLDHRG